MAQSDLIDLLKQYGNYPVEEDSQIPDYLKNPFKHLSSYVWNNSLGGMMTRVISDLFKELDIGDLFPSDTIHGMRDLRSDLLKELDSDKHRGMFNLK